MNFLTSRGIRNVAYMKHEAEATPARVLRAWQMLLNVCCIWPFHLFSFQLLLDPQYADRIPLADRITIEYYECFFVGVQCRDSAESAMFATDLHTDTSAFLNHPSCLPLSPRLRVRERAFALVPV